MMFGKKTWPGWAAAALLLFGVQAWIRNYPRQTSDILSGKSSALAQDTALPVALRFSDSSREALASAWDSSFLSDPFHRASMRPASAGSGTFRRPAAVSPTRRWKLKGTAGNSVATLIDSLGVKRLLRVGDSEGGAQLLEVHSNRVLMQDAAGRFELQPEP